eukprot:306702-Prorocentrum_lima.AAC.1
MEDIGYGGEIASGLYMDNLLLLQACPKPEQVLGGTTTLADEVVEIFREGNVKVNFRPRRRGG